MANPPDPSTLRPRRLPKIRPAPLRDRGIQERIGVLVARGLSYLASVTPLSVGYAVCDRFGDFLYWRSRTYRLNVIDNLRHVYSNDLTELQLRRRARTVFRMSARNFWDLIRSARMNREEFSNHINLCEGDWSTIEKIQREGKGGIFVTGHVGAFDSVSQILFVRGFDPYVLGIPTVGKALYAGVLWLRSRNGSRIEDISAASIRRLLRALKNGEFIGLVGDKDFTNQGMTVRFFGSEASLPAGPVRIARNTGVPIIPVFSERAPGTTGQRYRFHIGTPLYVERTEDEDADLQHAIEQVAGILEHYIRLMPEQWVMFQRVWQDTPSKRRKRTPLLRQARAAPRTGSASDAAVAESQPAPAQPSGN